MVVCCYCGAGCDGTRVMINAIWFASIIATLAVGVMFGGWAADRRWRQSARDGWRVESGGDLFTVQKQGSVNLAPICTLPCGGRKP